jgi:hypothetical protein
VIAGGMPCHGCDSGGARAECSGALLTFTLRAMWAPCRGSRRDATGSTTPACAAARNGWFSTRRAWRSGLCGTSCVYMSASCAGVVSAAEPAFDLVATAARGAAEIVAGRLRGTVSEIRALLACGQVSAQQIAGEPMSSNRINRILSAVANARFASVSLHRHAARRVFKSMSLYFDAKGI